MSKETAEYVNRVRNTYHYTINSENCSADRDEAGNFEFVIPPFPYPEHQGSQLGIFKLKEMWIGRQTTTNTQRVSQSNNVDLSGFVVQINGIGIRPQCYSNIEPIAVAGADVTARAQFVVINELAVSNNTASFIYPTVSGGKASDGYCLVSNPAGTTVRVNILNLDNGNPITDNPAYYTLIHFSIELIPTEISNGR